MSIEVTKQDGVCHMSIKDEMTIYTAAGLKNDLLEHLSGCDDLEVSLEDVSEIDSAGLQLLLVLHLEAGRSKKMIKFINHSDAVVDVLETLNLAAHFGDPIVLTAKEQ